jgi:hypothetical protein
MTTLDWLVVAFIALLAFNGMRQGFIVGVLQLAGFAAGAFAGSRIGPLILAGGSHSPYAPLFALGGAVLLGSFLGGWFQLAGAALRHRIHLPVIDTADGALGLVLGGVLAAGLVWVIGAVALQTPGLGLRRDVQRSRILRALNDALPPSGFVLNALARFDPLPQFAGPSTKGLASPPPRIARDPQIRAAARSVVRVLGTSCGLGVEGSGWVAAAGVVVTNAHVVAGESDTVVQAQGAGPKLDARVVAFDPTNDIAVLRVSSLGAPALPVAAPVSGRAAAVLGFPHNGPYDVRAARVGVTQPVLAEDAYGRGPVKRRITTLRGVVRSGNSGGPLVDADGRVVATVFASAVHQRPRGGYAVPEPVVRRRVAGAGSGRVSTGPCAR